MLAGSRSLDGGEQWIAELDTAREPWFWFASGEGMIHSDPAWNDDLALPFGLIATYVEKVEAGERIERPLETVEAERDRIASKFTVMLWGVNDDTVARWLDAADGVKRDELHGVAASPGVAEGLARVIQSPAELGDVQAGEVLVCPIPAPSWAPVFTKIAGAVSDIGGIMAHAGDRLPRVRPAGRHGHRLRHPADQDGPARPGGRQPRRGTVLDAASG